MTDAELETDLCPYINELWVYYQITPERIGMIKRWFSRYTLDQVKVAIGEYFHDSPDTRGPKWEAVRSEVFKRHGDRSHDPSRWTHGDELNLWYRLRDSVALLLKRNEEISLGLREPKEQIPLEHLDENWVIRNQCEKNPDQLEREDAQAVIDKIVASGRQANPYLRSREYMPFWRVMPGRMARALAEWEQVKAQCEQQTVGQ